MNAAPMTDALRDVIAERQRQIEVEGWTSEHDDAQTPGTLSRAAACYALSASKRHSLSKTIREDLSVHIRQLWPYGLNWQLKPKNPRADLVRAGALILAEIEAVDRYFEREVELASQARVRQDEKSRGAL